MKKKLAIIGAGIAGLTLANLIKKKVIVATIIKTGIAINILLKRHYTA